MSLLFSARLHVTRITGRRQRTKIAQREEVGWWGGGGQRTGIEFEVTSIRKRVIDMSKAGYEHGHDNMLMPSPPPLATSPSARLSTSSSSLSLISFTVWARPLFFSSSPALSIRRWSNGQVGDSFSSLLCGFWRLQVAADGVILTAGKTRIAARRLVGRKGTLSVCFDSLLFSGFPFKWFHADLNCCQCVLNGSSEFDSHSSGKCGAVSMNRVD